jgi:hypothetical protein
MVDLRKDGQFWGAATLVLYVGAVGFMLYLYFKDSREWREGLRKWTTESVPSFSENGKVDERTARSTVEDHRYDSAEPHTDGV